jgi:hypothetical protein
MTQLRTHHTLAYPMHGALHGFGNNKSISQMLAARENERGVQAHMGGKGGDESSIAAFLIGAYRCDGGRPCGSYLGDN